MLVCEAKRRGFQGGWPPWSEDAVREGEAGSDATVGRGKAKRIPPPRSRWGNERADDSMPELLRNSAAPRKTPRERRKEPERERRRSQVAEPFYHTFGNASPGKTSISAIRRGADWRRPSLRPGGHSRNISVVPGLLNRAENLSVRPRSVPGPASGLLENRLPAAT